MKVINSLKNLPKGKKIYASIWAFTGATMIVLIGLLVGYQTSSTKMTGNKWSLATPTSVNDVKAIGKKISVPDDLTDKNSAKHEITLTTALTTSPVTQKPLVWEDDKKQPNFVDYDSNTILEDAKSFTKYTFNNPTFKFLNITETEKANNGSNWATIESDLDGTYYRKDGDYTVAVSTTDPILDKTNVQTGDNVVSIKQDDVNQTTTASGIYAIQTARSEEEVVSKSDNTKKYKLVFNEYTPISEYKTFAWDKGSYDAAGKLTSDAAKEQNITAAIATLFFVGITFAIFTTVIVEVKAKKLAKLGGKK